MSSNVLERFLRYVQYDTRSDDGSTTVPSTPGQLVFQRETWYGAVLHNQTAYSLQRRLQWDGVPMVILPTRVRE